MDRVGRAGLLATLWLALPACSSTDSTDSDRSISGKDAGTTDPESSTPDPSGGRDDSASACFAACQNSSFSCQARSGTSTALTTVELALDGLVGCVGTTTAGTETKSLKLDCTARKVCVGDSATQTPTTCVSATFSALSFAYASGGGPETVCTRN